MRRLRCDPSGDRTTEWFHKFRCPDPFLPALSQRHNPVRISFGPEKNQFDTLIVMKTKIVYCLVSNGKDYYYEQLLISLCSLRKHNPDAVVEVVCDHATSSTLKGERSGIFEYGVQINSVETPAEWGNWERSRYIKTHLRTLTQGDYLFIDTDTVICASLDAVDDIPYEIAAVKDSHLDRPLPKSSQCQHDTEHWIWGQAQKVGVNIEGLWHYNSGVMYVKDTQKAYDLYAKWSEHYSKCLAHGAKVDQLPLLLSNHEPSYPRPSV